MKTTLLVGGLAALTLAAAGGAALAQQTPDRPARALRADADDDDRLSRAEFVAWRLQRLTAADADRDGSVTADERRAAAQARGTERADRRFDRLDVNDDGAISRAEFDAARAARGERGPGMMRAHRGPGRGHGPAHRGRTAARGPVVIADVQARAGQAFTRLDADHDGYLTAAERQSGRQAMLERMAAHRASRQASPRAPASE